MNEFWCRIYFLQIAAPFSEKRQFSSPNIQAFLLLLFQQQPPPPQNSIVAAPPTHDSGADQQFELELCWCIQSMEKTLEAGNLTAKQGK